MKTNKTQILARLVWASNLGAWENVHKSMRMAVAGLIRRGLMERVARNNSLRLTDAGIEHLRVRHIPLNAAAESAAGTADQLVPGAEYWTDSHQQRIPC